jgi:uncharacterized protein (TIGR00106 family)
MRCHRFSFLFVAFLFCRYKVTGEKNDGIKENVHEDNMALMHLTIVPLGTGSPSLGEYVADIQNSLEQSGFPYELTDMGTIIEGSKDDLLELAARLAEMPFAKGAVRVSTQISLDDRRDKEVSLGNKAASVAHRLK